MNTIEKVFEKINWPKRLTVLDGSHFSSIEQEIDFELPDDYKHFLCKYIGYEGFLGEQFFRLWDRDNLISMNHGYEIFKYLPSTLGIGSNGSSELIAMEKLGGGRLRIVLTPFIFDKRGHIEIGKSFTDFILSMDNGKEWFNN